MKNPVIGRYTNGCSVSSSLPRVLVFVLVGLTVVYPLFSVFFDRAVGWGKFVP